MNWTPRHIRLFREYLGDSQAKFAERCGLTRRQTVNEWEIEDESNPRRSVPTGTALKLLDCIAKEVGFDEKRLQLIVRGGKKDAGK